VGWKEPKLDLPQATVAARIDRGEFWTEESQSDVV